MVEFLQLLFFQLNKEKINLKKPLHRLSFCLPEVNTQSVLHFNRPGISCWGDKRQICLFRNKIEMRILLRKIRLLCSNTTTDSERMSTEHCNGEQTRGVPGSTLNSPKGHGKIGNALKNCINSSDKDLKVCGKHHMWLQKKQ